MGDSLKSLDLSIYNSKAENFGKKNMPDSSKNGKTSSGGTSVETIDFSGGSSVFNNTSTGTGSSTNNSTPTLDNGKFNGEFKFDEVDDFSDGQYSEKTLKEYFLQYGDIDADGKITNEDLSYIQNYLNSTDNNNNNGVPAIINNPNLIFDFKSQIVSTRINSGVGDIDGDGKVTIKDVTLMQKYITDGTFEPTNVNMANRLDTIKYTDVQTQINDDLSGKKSELDLIKNLIGQQNIVNSINVVPDSFNVGNNSNQFDVNSGNEADYLFYNSVNENNLDLSLPPEHGETDTEALRQSLIKRLVNSTLYRKNHNTMFLNINKGMEDAACDYVIKHAAEIVDYELEYGSLQGAKAAYQSNIAALTYSKKQMNKQMSLIPYDNTMKTADFKKWANNVTMDQFDPEKNADLKNCSKYMEYYKYLDPSQLAMFNYLLETKGEDEANKYLAIYEEDVNQAVGLEHANSFIDKLDKNFSKIVKEDGSLMNKDDMASLQDLLDKKKYDAKYDMNGDGKLTDEDMTKLTQYIEAGGEIETTFKNMQISFNGGFADGWNKFFAGFKYINDDTAVMSADEYKMLYIAQKLEQNGVISTSYEFGQTVGNMTPVILASAAATLATSYFGGEGGAVVLGASVSAEEVGKMTAATLIFSSTYGNAKHDALVKGHDLQTAVGYGVLSGVSEAGLEVLLGALPYVGSDCKNVFVAMFKEGFTESIQEFVGTMIGQYMLDEEVDITDLSAKMGKAFIFGALLCGAGYAGKAGVKVSINGVKYVLTSSQIMEYYNQSIDPVTGENNGLSLQDFVKKNVSPSDGTSASSTPESIVKDYQDNLNYYTSQGISLESYLADNNVSTINPQTKIETAEAIGDSKLYTIERLKQIRDSGTLSSSKLTKLNGIIDKYTKSGNGSYTTEDILNEASSFLSRADKKKIKSISQNGIADNAAKNYTYNQRAALYNYTACGGFEINGYLNNTTDANGVPFRSKYSSISNIQDIMSGIPGKNGKNMVFPSSSGDIIAGLDSVIANSNYDTPIKSYRGLKELYDGNTKIDPTTLKPGDSFTSAGYQSSSVVLENSYAKKPGYDIVLDITVPPNSGTAAYIENSAGVTNYGQMEVLIKRDATMTVTGDPYYKMVNGSYKLVVPVMVQ